MNIVRRVRAMRDHRWAPVRMSAYLDGELARRARTRLERHVEECEECRGLLRDLRRMLARLRRIPPPEARPDPEQMAARVRARLDESPPG